MCGVKATRTRRSGERERERSDGPIGAGRALRREATGGEGGVLEEGVCDLPRGQRGLREGGGGVGQGAAEGEECVLTGGGGAARRAGGAPPAAPLAGLRRPRDRTRQPA